MNLTHKPKDTELETENNSPVFKLQFSLHPVFVTGADCMIRLKLRIRKEGTLLQNIQRFSCNLVGMSCPRKIRCFHKRFCNTVPAVVITLSHPEPFNHSPGHLNMKTPPPPPPPSWSYNYLLLLNELGHSHCISFAFAETGWSIVSTGVWFGYRCSTASLTKFMTQLNKAIAWGFSSKSGIKPMLKTVFSSEMYSLLVMVWVSGRMYIIL